ncbi:hypothetical protein [Streptomyces indiaensis]|uniref:Uncharacterized protein n=1 Tax=Streptomyces indiaensis TaxID=284033 RepID=A0ABN3D4N7_9ACTN|nr:hypothetical protein [Streptomyces indiaensis]MCF1648448.1 hypothetical protein [Streptomyces indiaensis]
MHLPVIGVDLGAVEPYVLEDRRDVIGQRARGVVDVTVSVGVGGLDADGVTARLGEVERLLGAPHAVVRRTGDQVERVGLHDGHLLPYGRGDEVGPDVRDGAVGADADLQSPEVARGAVRVPDVGSLRLRGVRRRSAGPVTRSATTPMAAEAA